VKFKGKKDSDGKWRELQPWKHKNLVTEKGYATGGGLHQEPVDWGGVAQPGVGRFLKKIGCPQQLLIQENTSGVGEGTNDLGGGHNKVGEKRRARKAEEKSSRFINLPSRRGAGVKRSRGEKMGLVLGEGGAE